MNRFPQEKLMRVLWYWGKIMMAMAFATIVTSASSDPLALTYHFLIALVIVGYFTYQLISQLALATAMDPKGWNNSKHTANSMKKGIGVGLIFLQIAAGIGISFGITAGLSADDVSYSGTNFLIVILQDLIFNPIFNSLFAIMFGKHRLNVLMRYIVGDEAITIMVS
jgi:hypothetical protein